MHIQFEKVNENCVKMLYKVGTMADESNVTYLALKPSKLLQLSSSADAQTIQERLNISDN